MKATNQVCKREILLGLTFYKFLKIERIIYHFSKKQILKNSKKENNDSFNITCPCFPTVSDNFLNHFLEILFLIFSILFLLISDSSNLQKFTNFFISVKLTASGFSR